MQHLEEGTIHAWLDGALSAMEARDVEAHVASCAECSAMVAEARGLIAGASRIVSSLDVVRGNVIPNASAGRGGKSVWRSLHLSPARAALAATLLLAVSTLLTARHDTPSKLVVDSPPIRASAPATVDVKKTPDAPSLGAPPTVTTTPSARSTLAAQAKDRKPVVTEAGRDEAKVDSLRVADKPTTVGVTGAAAPPAAAAGAAVANALDTSERRVLAKAAVRAERARMEVAPRVATMQSLRVADNVVVLPACFEFTAGETMPSNLPRRFALQTLPGDTARHVVGAVNDDGRIDSVLSGSTWTRTTPTEITVRFASNEQTLTLPIKDGASGAASAVAPSQRKNFARQVAPSVSRVACQP